MHTPRSTPALRRALSVRDLIVFGLLFIGPLATVGFFGVLDARADGAVALVYVLATLAMGCTAWSYAQMSRVVPHAGSVFAYAREAIGPGAGFIAGWMAMLDYLLIPAVAYLISGIAVHAIVPAIPAWVFTVVAFVVTTGFNLAGVEVAARVGRWVLIAELAVLALFVAAAVWILVTEGPHRPLSSPFVGMGELARPGVALIAQVMGAVAIAVNSFLGFDAIASFAEENTGDSRQVGRAIAFCFIVAGVVFVVQAYLASVLSIATPADRLADPESQGTAFYTVTRTAIGAWMATVVAVTKAIGPAFAAMTGQAAAGRLLFGMARDGRLPRMLSGVNADRGVPTAALSVAATLTLVVAVWAALRPDGLELIVSIVNVGALVAFAMLHASVFAYYVLRRRAPAGLRHWLIPVAGVGITLWVLASTGRSAQLIGVAWAVVGLVSLRLSRSRPVSRGQST